MTTTTSLCPVCNVARIIFPSEALYSTHYHGKAYFDNQDGSVFCVIHEEHGAVCYPCFKKTDLQKTKQVDSKSPMTYQVGEIAIYPIKGQPYAVMILKTLPPVEGSNSPTNQYLVRMFDAAYDSHETKDFNVIVEESSLQKVPG